MNARLATDQSEVEAAPGGQAADGDVTTPFVRRTLESLAASVDYGVTASANAEDVGPQFLRITDIQDDRVDWDSVPYCEAKPAEEAAARLEVGDIVFARTGATTGMRWTQLFGPFSASAKRDLLGSGSSFYFNAGSGSSQ